MKILNQISNQIQSLEAIRDLSNITDQESELLAVLNLCYDLLARTQLAQSETVPTPDEFKEPGFTDEEILQYSITSDAIADFAFSVAVGNGTTDLRQLLRRIMWGKTQKEIAHAVGIRINTISDYLTGKKNITAGNYEKIVNYCINQKGA